MPPKQLSAKQQEARREKRRRKRAARRKENANQQAINVGRQIAVNAVNKERRRVGADSSAGHLLSKMMMCPAESSLIRIPTIDMPPVAVVKLREVDYFVESNNSPTANFGGFTYVNFFFGKPNLLYMDGPFYNTTALIHSYRFEDFAGSTIVASWIVQIAAGKQANYNEDIGQWWPIVCMQEADTRFQKNRPMMLHDGVKWGFHHVGENIELVPGVVTGTAPIGFVRIGLFRFVAPSQPPMWVSEVVQNFPTWPSVSFDIPSEGWYALKLEELRVDPTSSTINSLRLQLRWTSDPSGHARWRFKYNEDLKAELGQCTRRTASSLLVTNRTNVLHAQGDVIAGRISYTMPGSLDVTDAYTAVKKAQDRYTGFAAKGCYTYKEFTSDDEHFNSACDAYGFPIFHWSDDMVNLITIANGVIDNLNNYAIVADTIMESKTQSQLYPMTVSPLNPMELIEARRINSMTSYFYENDIHWPQIREYIMKMWKWTRAHANALGTAASIMAPELAPVIKPVAAFLQN